MLPMIWVSRKKGTQIYWLEALIQFHIDSIHSPHSTLNTMRKAWGKSLKFQRGVLPATVIQIKKDKHITAYTDHTGTAVGVV